MNRLHKDSQRNYERVISKVKKPLTIGLKEVTLDEVREAEDKLSEAFKTLRKVQQEYANQNSKFKAGDKVFWQHSEPVYKHWNGVGIITDVVFYGGEMTYNADEATGRKLKLTPHNRPEHEFTLITD